MFYFFILPLCFYSFIYYTFTHPPITFPLFCFGNADAPPDNTIISPCSNSPLSFKFSIPALIVSSIEASPSTNTGNVPNTNDNWLYVFLSSVIANIGQAGANAANFTIESPL